jgi:threonine dehydrogenase-like Zn-dependent dehydrogenase
MEIAQQTHIQPNTRVLLVGAGRLGQLIAQALALTGCELSVVARHTRQREILAGSGIPTQNENQVQERAWDLVVEATGSASGFEMARRAVRPRGVIVVKSTYKGSIEINLSALVVNEITVIGSRCGPFPPAMRALRTGLVDPRPLVSARYQLSQAIQAFGHAAQSGALKVLIQPD